MNHDIEGHSHHPARDFLGRPSRPAILGGGLALLLILGLCAGIGRAAREDASAKDTSVPKQQRQIGIMEGIIDQALIDSPNFRVMGRDNTRGIYLDEFGAIFTFEASLVGSPFDFSGAFKVLNGLTTGKDGTVFWSNSDDSSGTSDSSDQDKTRLAKARAKLKKEMASRQRDIEELRARTLRPGSGDKDNEPDPATLYKQGKEELVQVLLDYGATLTTLRDDQSIALAGFLRDSRYFTENKLSKLVLKVKVGDLRAFSDGRLSEEQIRSRIQTSEY